MSASIDAELTPVVSPSGNDSPARHFVNVAPDASPVLEATDPVVERPTLQLDPEPDYVVDKDAETTAPGGLVSLRSTVIIAPDASAVRFPAAPAAYALSPTIVEYGVGVGGPTTPTGHGQSSSTATTSASPSTASRALDAARATSASAARAEVAPQRKTCPTLCNVT